jgi:hypothetical protein
MFSTMAPEQTFPEAVRAAIAAYRVAGLDVELLVENDAFARLRARDPSSGRDSKVEFGVDWRQYPPAVLDIGPVLARDDAVANKVCALYSRGQARDYIDVDAALRSQAYTHQELLELAEAHDPGSSGLISPRHSLPSAAYRWPSSLPTSCERTMHVGSSTGWSSWGRPCVDDPFPLPRCRPSWSAGRVPGAQSTTVLIMERVVGRTGVLR